MDNFVEVKNPEGESIVINIDHMVYVRDNASGGGTVQFNDIDNWVYISKESQERLVSYLHS